MNLWGVLFLAPIALLVVASPYDMIPTLIGGAIGYGVLLWIFNAIFGPKPPR